MVLSGATGEVADVVYTVQNSSVSHMLGIGLGAGLQDRLRRRPLGRTPSSRCAPRCTAERCASVAVSACVAGTCQQQLPWVTGVSGDMWLMVPRRGDGYPQMEHSRAMSQSLTNDGNGMRGSWSLMSRA